MCHQADTAPAFLFSEQKKQVEEVLRVDPKNLNSYVGVVNQPPPKWSSVKKWLLHINYAPGYPAADHAESGWHCDRPELLGRRAGGSAGNTGAKGDTAGSF